MALGFQVWVLIAMIALVVISICNPDLINWVDASIAIMGVGLCVFGGVSLHVCNGWWEITLQVAIMLMSGAMAVVAVLDALDRLTRIQERDIWQRIHDQVFGSQVKSRID